MVLKRKRSSSEFSSSTASSSASPPQKHTINFNFNLASGDAFAMRSAAMSPSPSHLNSRTMKRFRNGRPSEDEVHQRTLDMLYSAQRQLVESEMPLASTEEDMPEEQQFISPELGSVQQSSLHRFWNIRSAPRSTPDHSVIHGATDQPLTAGPCPHCRTGVMSPDGDDMMDVDGMAGAGAACGACERRA